MFRSSGPRRRHPAAPPVPHDHGRVRRQTAVLEAAQLVLAAADPTLRNRRRTEIVRYLRLQGGVLHDDRGLLTRHLRAALGRGPDIHRILRGMERDGLITRDVRGRRTYAVVLVDPAAERTPPPAVGAGSDVGDAGTDFGALLDALVTMIDKRLAVADRDNRPRIEALEDARAELRRYRDEHRAVLATGDRDAERAFVERTLETMTANALHYEARTGFRIDDAFTATEHRTLLRLVQGSADHTA